MRRKRSESACGNEPSEFCYENQCPDIMKCEPMRKSKVFYPVAAVGRHCEYVDAQGHRCRKLAYYWVLNLKTGRMEYRCYYDCPIGQRTTANRIRLMKGPLSCQ